MSLDNPTDPIIVTDTDDLAKMFGAHLIGFTGGRIGYDAANRLGQSLIEIMRANCPTPPDLIDDLGGHWYWFAGYVSDDGSLRTRASLDDDPELSPVTEKES